MVGNGGFGSGFSDPESDNQIDNHYYREVTLICMPLQFCLAMEVTRLQRFAVTRSLLQYRRHKTGGQEIAGSNPAAPTT